MHIVVVRQDLDVFEHHVCHRRVFKILAEAANGDTISPVDCQLQLSFVLVGFVSGIGETRGHTFWQ